MDIQVSIDPSETDIEAQLRDTPSGVRLIQIRFGAVVLHMDVGTWILAKHAVEEEARRLNQIIAQRVRSRQATPSPYDCGGNPTKDYPGE